MVRDLERRANALEIADVECRGKSLAALRHDFGGGALDGCFVAVGEHHRRTVPRKDTRGLEAHAAGGAGDEYGLAGEGVAGKGIRRM